MLLGLKVRLRRKNELRGLRRHCTILTLMLKLGMLHHRMIVRGIVIVRLGVGTLLGGGRLLTLLLVVNVLLSPVGSHGHTGLRLIVTSVGEYSRVLRLLGLLLAWLLIGVLDIGRRSRGRRRVYILSLCRLRTGSAGTVRDDIVASRVVVGAVVCVQIRRAVVVRVRIG